MGEASGKSSVELAYSDPGAKDKDKVKQEATGKMRKVWSLRLILTVIAIVLCWSGGLYWVFRPEPTAASRVTEMVTLNDANMIVLEPDMVFFQLPIDPIHQKRWIESLGMEPVPIDGSLTIPTYHALSSWEQPNKYIRPPYAWVEVDEWWELKLRRIRYGFEYRWDDGSILILDLESDMLIGWSRVKHLPELMN
jgi:hypothetical protein